MGPWKKLHDRQLEVPIAEWHHIKIITYFLGHFTKALRPIILSNNAKMNPLKENQKIIPFGQVGTCSPRNSPLDARFWHHENWENSKVILKPLTTFIQATNAGVFSSIIPPSVPYLTLCPLFLVAEIWPVPPTAFNTAHHGN